MTLQSDQIQNLIQEIDAVLSKASPRLPWVMSGEMDQQRRVLEQTRSYLVNLQTQVSQPGLATNPFGYPIAPGGDGSPAESAQQVLQAVLQEMSYLRSNVMQPLRQDLEGLNQQKEALTQEIRLLEAQRQQYALPQHDMQQQMITEFLQSLMGRLQENLTGQVVQMVASLEAQSVADRALPSATETSYATSALTPAQRLEQLQMIQAQSDQLLLRLDTTLRVIFESLQSNIQSYQESLSRGLDKMHNLGQQGEAMFTALVNRLAQQLGREASSYLQSSMQGTEWDIANRPLPGASLSPDVTLRPASDPSPAIAEDADPIDRLLSELQTSEPTVIQAPTPSPQAEPGNQSPDLDLNLLDLELQKLDLAEDVDGEPTLFQYDQPITQIQLDDDDLTLFQLDEEPTIFQSEPITQAPNLPSTSNIADLDSALDFLNQLSEEQRTNETDAPAEATTPAEDAVPDDMKELYNSLFGMNAETVAEEDAEPPIDQHMAEAIPTIEAMTAADQDSDLLSSAGVDLPMLADLSVTPSEDAIAAIDDSLFAGLSDPAEDADLATEEPLPARSPELADMSTQSLENFLFEEPLFPESGTLDDLARLTEAGQFTTPTEGSAEEASEVESIASLADLNIPTEEDATDDDQTEALDLPDPSLTDPEQTMALGEEDYVSASPDENLLVTEDGEERADLRLPPNMIQQLTTDLSNLEGLEGDDLLPTSTDEPDDDDWTLILGTSESAAPYVEQSEATQTLDAEAQPIALDDDLFASEPLLGAASDEVSSDELSSDELSSDELFTESFAIDDALVVDLDATEEAAALSDEGATEPVDLSDLALSPPIVPGREELSPDDFRAVMTGETAAVPVPTPVSDNPSIAPAVQSPIAEPTPTAETEAASRLIPGREDLTPDSFKAVMSGEGAPPLENTAPAELETIAPAELPPSPQLLPGREALTPEDFESVMSVSLTSGQPTDDDLSLLDEVDELEFDSLPDTVSALRTPDSIAASDPAELEAVLADLFADSPDQPEPTDLTTEEPIASEAINAPAIELEAVLSDLFADVPEEPAPAEGQTLEDLDQATLPVDDVEVLESEPSATLETPLPSPEEADEDLLASLFGDELDSPVDSPPEEEGMTLDDLAAAMPSELEFQNDSLEDFVASLDAEAMRSSSSDGGIAPPANATPVDMSPLPPTVVRETASVSDTVNSLSDLFDGVDPSATSDPSAPSLTDLTQSLPAIETQSVEPVPSDLLSADEANAFTLEGLENLFEDLPDVGSPEIDRPSPSNDADLDGLTVETAFGNLDDLPSESDDSQKKSL